MSKYNPSSFESKWQKRWQRDRLYDVDLTEPQNKYYVLVELPYTSGPLHIGHWFTFSKGDILARYKRMQGHHVIFPVGFDTFGLPAENAAIRHKMHPKEWTEANIQRMKEQFSAMGASIDWSKSIITCDPGYYRWNQWIFLKMLERGVAYKGKTLSNWCPSCQTVLADENVEAGKCWRCGSQVERQEVEQWFLRITDYADKLLWTEPPAADWPKSLRIAQNNWIGKSVGVRINFGAIEVFTTRQDTIFGATFVVISPEHPLLAELITEDQKVAVEEYVRQARKKSEQERKENKDKSGVFTGSTVINPLSGERVPVWVADYVLLNYGSGAVMGVPAHDERDFEFAKRYDLPIRQVVKPNDRYRLKIDSPYEGEGILTDSGEYSGMNSAEAREKLSKYIVNHQLGREETNYHLRDWSISRQRYWGTPIPVVYCPKCGIVPVPEAELPVVLPDEVDYTPTGKPPLATNKDWVQVKCFNCGADAKREVETMDGFIDNSWYFYRYLDPENDTKIFDSEIIANWMPIEIYIGGSEHTYGHALYSRFFSEFFRDLGLIDFAEYTRRRVHHGVILGPDGARMSKSRGNVVDPDITAAEYGADAVRVYLNFLGPIDTVASWVPGGLYGSYHFLQRVWSLADSIDQRLDPSAKDQTMMHRAIKKVTEDLEVLGNNTAIAALMEWLNYLTKKERVVREEYRTLLLLLAPFAPFMTEELWFSHFASEDTSKDGKMWSIHRSAWPKYDPQLLLSETVTVVVQLNGKVRGSLEISRDLLNNESEVVTKALMEEKIKQLVKDSPVKKTIYVPGRVLNIVV